MPATSRDERMPIEHHSYHHRGGSAALLGATIPAHVAGSVARYPDHEALVSLPQDRRLTYTQLEAAVHLLARGLLGSGFSTGDRIGIWSTNNVEWLLLQLATARIGAILVNINPGYRTRELGYALQRSAVNGLFMIPGFRSSDYVAMLTELIPELQHGTPEQSGSGEFPALRRVVIFDPAAPDASAPPYPGFTTWQEVLAAAEAVSTTQLQAVTDALDMDDPINIQYTSGTTGFPKAVLLSHHNILNNAWFSAQAMHCRCRSTTVSGWCWQTCCVFQSAPAS
jgi:fatty-acyl-CoA synthase